MTDAVQQPPVPDAPVQNVQVNPTPEPTAAEAAKAKKANDARLKKEANDAAKAAKKQKKIDDDAAKAAAKAEKAKAPATPVAKDVRNGISRPKSGVTAQVWATADDLSAKAGGPIERSVLSAALSGSVETGTIHTQYGRWRKYYGLSETRDARRARLDSIRAAKKTEKEALATKKAADKKAAADAAAAKKAAEAAKQPELAPVDPAAPVQAPAPVVAEQAPVDSAQAEADDAGAEAATE
jgi:hypothetical protein